MALSTVTVTWDEEDVGADALGGYVSFQLTNDLQDQADGIDVRRNPARTVFFAGPSGSSPPLVANDNAVTPAGTAYVITVAIQGQAPVTFTSAINHANGATQTLAFLQANAAVPSVQYAQFLPLPSGTAAAGNVPVASGTGSASAWGTPAGGSGTVTSASVATANGFAGTVANPTTTPAITVSTTVTGLLKGNGTAVSAAAAGTDYLAPTGSGAALTGITAAQVGADASGAAAAVLATSAQKAANLSDLASAATARTNLGLGSAAVQNTSAFDAAGAAAAAAAASVPLSDLPVSLANGGTGQVTAAAAYNALSPMSAKGDMEYDSAAGVASRLAVGSAGQVLGVSAGVPAWGVGLTLLAAVSLAGYTLVNGTGTIISWTAPADGLLHRVELIGARIVTSADTGGQVTVSFTDPNNGSQTFTLFAASSGGGYHAPLQTNLLVKAGATVTIAQSTALTVGAATLWAEIWGS